MSGASDRNSAKAAASPDWPAADIGGAVVVAGGNGRNGWLVVLTVNPATSSPTDRAASTSTCEASRNLACQTGASTT